MARDCVEYDRTPLRVLGGLGTIAIFAAFLAGCAQPDIGHIAQEKIEQKYQDFQRQCGAEGQSATKREMDRCVEKKALRYARHKADSFLKKQGI